MDSRSSKTELGNGLTIISERHRSYQGISIGVWVKIGTRHERSHEAGISHFLEHMLFKGTESRSALQIARAIDQVGGEFNAFTSRESTCFHINLLARDLDLAIEILSDVVLNSSFDPEELERERKVILQEISMVEESPEELIYDLFYELAYGKSGLGRPILGTENSIRKMKRGDLLRFFRKYYRPENTIVSVAGNFSHAKLVKKLRPLARREWPARGPKPSAASRKRSQDLHAHARASVFLKEGRWWVKRHTEQTHILFGIDAPTYGSKDRVAMSLLNLFLGGGMSSLLFQEIREKRGLAYTVYSGFSPYHDAGLFTIYAATSAKQTVQCLKVIEECLERLKTGGKGFLISTDELRSLKENLKSSVILSAESMESRMLAIASNDILTDEVVRVSEVCAAIDSVELSDLRRLAKKLCKARRSVLFLGPRPSPSIKKRLRPSFPKRYNR